MKRLLIIALVAVSFASGCDRPVAPPSVNVPHVNWVAYELSPDRSADDFNLRANIRWHSFCSHDTGF